MENKKRYWLRGGITGAMLAIIIVFIFLSPFFDVVVPDSYNGLIQSIFLIIFLLTPIILWGKSFLYMYVIGPVVWFILGAIIGLIYGKIKK